MKGGFVKDNKGRAVSLQTIWEDKAMPRMREDEFTPIELLRGQAV
ncbi:hypothetical protein [Pontibacter toksunensis]